MKYLSGRYTFATTLVVALLFATSCEKDPIVVDDNTAPDLESVPRVLIENYVNRMFIDLIGREPLNTEMDSMVALLKADTLDYDTRAQIVDMLQWDTTFIAGDSSYKKAYFHRLYEQGKVRCIEGDSDAEIMQKIGILNFGIQVDSIEGDSIGIALKKVAREKYYLVLAIDDEYRNGDITINEAFYRLCNNGIYDEINMNTFNFINATFDNLFYRFPTNAEFDAAWEMVEENRSVNLLGGNGQNKGDYLEILTSSREFYTGLIHWAYLSLLQREPTTAEVYDHMQYFYPNADFQELQKRIIITDEYANF